jgi:radical SAM superfamily enzyme YgiQ (UPF0313 family)
VRKVPVEQVIEQLKRSRSQYVVFLDDNLTADRKHAMALFEGMKGLKIKFLAQVTVKFILDDTLFQAALAAGLKGVFVGFETIEEEGRSRLIKSVPLEACRAAIRKCQSSHCFMHSAFIFGLDEHDKTIFSRTLDFVMENNLISVGAYILTPYPGTPLFDRLVAEGRLLHRNWSYYDHGTPVFLPQRMTLEQLAEGYLRFRESVFSLRGIGRRLATGLWACPGPFLHVNLALRRVTSRMRDHYQNYFDWLGQANLVAPTATGWSESGEKNAVAEKLML